MRFLKEGQILNTVRQLVRRDGELLAAVAFWGKGAGQETGITERAHPTRILCDLLSGACNPCEIRRLMDSGAEVKYRPQLHAKVWTNGNEVVVGSANASMNGLGFETAGPNIEAAVYLCDEQFAGDVREWFTQEWDCAECVDDELLQTADVLWNQKQNAGNAIMRCRITAYEESGLTPEERDRFDQIACCHYSEQELDEIRARAQKDGVEHWADSTCYWLEPGDMLSPTGTVYMDWSRGGDGGDFKFGGFWEIIHNERLENDRTLCLLRKKDGRKFRVPPGCGDRNGIAAMVNCHMNNHGEDNMDMEFRVFYERQKRHCKNREQPCGADHECPFRIAG